MKVAIGGDPNAYAMKKEIVEELNDMGHEVTDFGSEDSIYAKVVIDVAEAVAAGKYDRGIVLCGTGIGASIAANKVEGAYCALVNYVYQAERAALSNNANMLAMGQQVTGNKVARLMARVYMENTDQFDFSGRSGPKVQYIYDYASKHKDNLN